jgi:tRNA threonylcarbamoyladenosine biosynthesis protein TsaE
MRLHGVAQSAALGRRLAELLRPGDVVALFGALGAGKTTISRAILEAVGVEGEVASPTFPIVLVYDPPEARLPVWHVDLYRIEGEEALEELGLDEALDDGVLLIEWPERMGDALWRHSLCLYLSVEEDGSRALTAKVPEAWEARWSSL